ncbi:hypothetical protein PTKU46_84420 [Paraburkholderia terrae]
MSQRLHMQAKIDARALKAVVTKQIADRLHADASLEQAHGEAMPQAVGTGLPNGQTTEPRALGVDVVDRCGLDRTGWAPHSQE